MALVIEKLFELVEDHYQAVLAEQQIGVHKIRQRRRRFTGPFRKRLTVHLGNRALEIEAGVPHPVAVIHQVDFAPRPQRRHHRRLQQGAFAYAARREQQSEFVGEDFVHQNPSLGVTTEEVVAVGFFVGLEAFVGLPGRLHVCCLLQGLLNYELRKLRITRGGRRRNS